MNDIGPNSTDLSWATPRLEALARGGVRLTRYYTMHLCTPARAALLTGKYPMHIGMQHSMLSGNEPWGLPLNNTIAPQYAAALGYRSVAIGKWHLGHFKREYTPLARGFDEYFGYYTGFTDHYRHVSEITFCAIDGAGCWFDLRDGDKPVVDREGDYTMYAMRDKARAAIEAHEDPRVPLFLYFACATVHMPVQPPSDVFSGPQAARLARIPNARRRAFAAATVATDDVAGDIVDALVSRDLWENTIFVCASDNGAQPQTVGAGSNYPFRGMKGFYFEGGVRTHAFVHSRLLGGPATYDGLFSVVDWLPTLFGTVVERADGVDQWANLAAAARGAPVESPRTEVVINVDVVACDPNSTVPDCDDGDYYATGAIVFNQTLKLLRNVFYLPVWPVPLTDDLDNDTLPGWSTDDWYNPVVTDFVFDLADDPTESLDLKTTRPDLYESLSARFDAVLATAVPPAYCSYADDLRARKVFNATKFLGPWLADKATDRETKACIDRDAPSDDEDGSGGNEDEASAEPAVASKGRATYYASVSNPFPNAVYCRYGLLPSASSACADQHSSASLSPRLLQKHP
ncbi:hypothetical protein CTAYLR_007241 [Chrysophaeum taylorii]|uniref:Sulfatase N-terminal domain-containing protein n=1 Tax=Chrysophaeum taylorii TaxID=2483200 RepID=A0AAD7UAH9_9STRA|nr:hypothetical protein CTAYLR_007241 [Chrysophaeum taylorii]